jgi:uncharacterized protein (DUF169 family)
VQRLLDVGVLGAACEAVKFVGAPKEIEQHRRVGAAVHVLHPVAVQDARRGAHAFADKLVRR